ncbi:hypothetical protein BJQ94_02710 [Cryobacterium sp. SO2]|uniref:hypothetical protein n=1 Tax=Cryobacterium sp. SO2 TaxID=1897060 RepID=UPI00223CFB17|nr:hypothetical protein [Cryobacterium sp. SO2]WEO77969.1 hypothetical protein BJQ94_02710 [Cryobacterium sp. SO2]
MRINKVHVDGQAFIIAEDENVPALKEQILASLKVGRSAFVDFESTGIGLVSVLITPNVRVRFEAFDRTEEQMRDSEPVATSQDIADIDWFLEHP